jgi:Matrixin
MRGPERQPMTDRKRAAAAAALVVGLAAADASAFCRTRTCQLSDKIPCPLDDLSGCYTSGSEVYWGNTCISYALQRDGSLALGITAEQVAPLVDEAFRAWSDVSCARGGSPPLSARSQGSIACDAVEFNCDVIEDNSNLIVFRDEFVDRREFRFGVIALTTLTANVKSGEIFDADIEINSRDEEFVLGPPPPGSFARDLQGVLNHEIGHLLGLSHPNVRGALMYFNYQGSLLPAEDDIAGICDALGGAANDPECSVVELPPDAGCVGSNGACSSQTKTVYPGSNGCACQVGSNVAGRGAGWLGWLAVACTLGRRAIPSGRQVGRASTRRPS